ncbi:hypothetical protein TNCV_636401 [Trichonephila clavipes]|nr:hypothetical protein TNCV_636401 [Trichonephila clavipes]
MADLPSDRVTVSRVFTKVGIDYVPVLSLLNCIQKNFSGLPVSWSANITTVKITMVATLRIQEDMGQTSKRITSSLQRKTVDTELFLLDVAKITTQPLVPCNPSRGMNLKFREVGVIVLVSHMH